MWFAAEDKLKGKKRAGGADEGAYWNISRQPLAALLFLLPMVAAYELGAHYMVGGGVEPVRNGADHWLRSAMAGQGWDEPWLLPAVLLGGLLAWHIVGGFRWKVTPATLLGMLVESVLFGLCLVCVGEAQEWLVNEFDPQPVRAPTAALDAPSKAELARMLSFFGAGIYEETLFRLGLLPVCFGVLRAVSPRPQAMVLAVLVSSLMFSAAHYVGPAADPFNGFGFVFRTLAGVMFASVMVTRGFGICVGTHAVYDILVGILLPGKLLDPWLSSGG